jgi:hypothetical protein
LEIGGTRRGYGRGRYPLWRHGGDALHILLNCLDTRNCKKFLNIKWLIVDDKMAYKRKIDCTNSVKLKTV